MTESEKIQELEAELAECHIQLAAYDAQIIEQGIVLANALSKITQFEALIL